MTLPVASGEHLLAMKVLSWDEDRPRDLMDIRALLNTALDLSEVRAALDAIHAAGTHQQQDLKAKLDQLLE